MSHLILVCLLLLVLFLGYRQWLLRRGLRELAEAVHQRRPLLEADDHLPRTHASWRILARETNQLIRAFEQVRQGRSDQLSQLDAALGNLHEAVLVVEENNYVVFANRALGRIFPAAQDAVGRRVEVILRSADFLNLLDRVRQERSPTRQEIRFGEPGSEVIAEITGVIVPPAGGRAGEWLLFVLHDVSRERRLEEVRKEFVANVSHELKTPLSVIKGYAETLAEDHATMAAPQREQFLRAIQRHAERLTGIVDDLLTLSRLESANPGMQRAAVNLAPFVHGVVADYRDAATRAGQTLTAAVDPSAQIFANVDPLRMTQVLGNLIDNARKYSPAGASVTVQVEARVGEREVELSVVDTGPGIPPGDLPRVFERFYRVEKGRARGTGGTGLGLSIVKHIVQLHGGRVWAESHVGKGTRMVIRLPLIDAPGGPTPHDAGAARSEAHSGADRTDSPPRNGR